MGTPDGEEGEIVLGDCLKLRATSRTTRVEMFKGFIVSPNMEENNMDSL